MSERSLTDELTELGEALSADHLRDDASGEFPWKKWRLLADTGLYNLATDTANPDGRLVETLQAMETLGYVCRDSGLSFSAASHLASCGVSLTKFGNAALRAGYLPAIRTGDRIGAHAITEPEVGSEALAMGTTAVRDGDTFVLNGRKAFVSNGPIADQIVIYARTGPAGTAASLTAFLVDRESKGLRIGPAEEKMGLRTSPLGELELVGVRVPADHVVGFVGGGFLVLHHEMAREVLAVSAVHIGEMRYRFERCLERSKQRTQFGKPIGAFQAVSHQLVDMKIGWETARRWLYDTAARIVAGQDATAEVAITKLVTSEAAVNTARHAVQIFGGAGYLTETGIERTVRDSLAATIYSGTSEIQKNRVATLMGVPVE